MQNHVTCLLLGVVAALSSGCAGVPQATVLKTVGPAPSPPKSQSSGFLVAYTPVQLPPMSSDTLFYPHTSYALYDRHGVWLRQVRNHLGAWDESPEWVSLRPGRYSIRAQSGSAGDLIVPILIRGGSTTVVDLCKDSRYSVTALNPG